MPHRVILYKLYFFFVCASLCVHKTFHTYKAWGMAEQKICHHHQPSNNKNIQPAEYKDK